MIFQKTSRCKPFWATLIVVVILCINLISMVSAWDWDNVKNYNKTTKTIEIRNSVLGFDWWQLDTM